MDYSVKDTLNTIESGHKENSFPMGKDCNYTLKTGPNLEINSCMKVTPTSYIRHKLKRE